MIAAELADFDHGGDRSKSPNGGLKIAEAAQALNVGERTVERAIQVKDKAAPEVVAAVKAGKRHCGGSSTTMNTASMACSRVGIADR